MQIELRGRRVWINFHHLFCFHAIATGGGLAEASRKLSIGTSALSIQMKQFEAELDAKLFERSRRRLDLTETGRMVLDYAKEIFRLGSEMVESLNDQTSSDRVHLQIGVLDTIPKHLTLRLTEEALSGGKATVSVFEDKSQDLLHQLIEHRIDLVLTNRTPSSAVGKLYVKRIARLPLWIVGTKAFLKLKENFPKSLGGEPLIVPTAESSVRLEIDSFFKRHHVEPLILGEAQDVAIQELLALRGLGMTVVPEFAIQEHLDQKRLHRIGKLGDAEEELFLVAAARRIENPVAASLMRKFRI